MINTVIFLDTNIIIDYLQNREPYSEHADAIFELRVGQKITIFISAQSVNDVFYILRKDYSVSDRKNMLLALCKMVNIIGADKAVIINALVNEDFSDFEDCIQAECAKIAEAEYIVTRNIKDFTGSEVRAVSPEDFLELADILK